MKKYSKPELEIFNVQVADYCATVDVSDPTSDSASANEGFVNNSVSIADDLDD